MKFAFKFFCKILVKILNESYAEAIKVRCISKVL